MAGPSSHTYETMAENVRAGSPSIEDMNAFGMTASPTEESAVDSQFSDSTHVGDDLPSEASTRRRKGRILSVSTERSRSLSVSVVPPPTSVLWSHSTPTHKHEDIYGSFGRSGDGGSFPGAGLSPAMQEAVESGRPGELKVFDLWETKTVGNSSTIEARTRLMVFLFFSALLSSRIQHVAN